MMMLAAIDTDTGMPENFGGIEIERLTNIHPIGIAAVLILGIAMLVLPRRWTVLPMLLIACFIPASQEIVLFGLNFDLLRIMILFGVARLCLKRDYIAFVWKPIDKLMVWWVISSIVIYTLQQGTFLAFVNRLGFAFDAFGMYFLFRCLIRDWSDIDTAVFGCLLISIPVMVAFLVESRTGRNVFSVFGGVPEITLVREGRVRSQGAYSHSILAGCFWASLMPLIATFWWKSNKGKVLAVVGLGASMIIVICCASSTPIMGVIAAIVGGLFFCLRKYMRPVRWAILFTLVALHMVMKAPVWHLVSRVDAVGGSTGFHRYMLIDGAINYFNEWALLGTKSTAHWGEGAQDVTNQFIWEGVQGGFLTFCLFIAVIVYAFRSVGHLWRSQIQNKYRLAISWALGVSLFVHCMNFIGVSYFGQIYILWYLLLAMIGSAAPATGRSLLPIQSAARNLPRNANSKSIFISKIRQAIRLNGC